MEHQQTISDTISDYDERDPVRLLARFGLSGQEASVYLSLLTGGEMNGYELSKALSLSRSNAYTTLASLSERGAVWTVEGTPVRYQAVPPAEWCDNEVRSLAAARDRLLTVLPVRRETPGSYITIRGADRILDRLRHLVAGAEERAYLALGGEVLRAIAGEISAHLRAGKKLVVITDAETARSAKTAGSGGDFPFLAGATVHALPCESGQIRAIADSRFVMTGELGDDTREATCLYSDHPNLVELFKTALRNEIRLADLTDPADLTGPVDPVDPMDPTGEKERS